MELTTAYEMHSVTLTWRKCSSVTYRGKPYFFVAFHQKDKYTVVWNRLEESWVVTKNDAYLTNVSTPTKGRAYAERMAEVQP